MSAKSSAYDNHKDEKDTWSTLMNDWFSASRSAVECFWIINVQPLANNKTDLIQFIKNHLENFVDVATWNKGHAAPQIQQGVMASAFEWMLMFSKTKNPSRRIPFSSWQGTVQNVLNNPPQRKNDYSGIHAATMPIHVPVWVLKTVCDLSKSVYEPFCGTGTTLIAAEQLGRTCYGMELSPQYCDVIVQRWETLTGQKAERQDADGKTRSTP